MNNIPSTKENSTKDKINGKSTNNTEDKKKTNFLFNNLYRGLIFVGIAGSVVMSTLLYLTYDVHKNSSEFNTIKEKFRLKREKFLNRRVSFRSDDKVLHIRFNKLNITIANETVIIMLFAFVYLILSAIFRDIGFSILLGCFLIYIYNSYLNKKDDDINNENKDNNK